MGGHLISWRMSLVVFIYIQKVERETTLERLKQLGRQIKRLIVRQSGSQAGRWTDRKADRQTDRQTRVKLEDRMWKETQRQTDGQTFHSQWCMLVPLGAVPLSCTPTPC